MINTFLSSDRRDNQTGGGVGFYVKNGINFKIRNYLSLPKEICDSLSTYRDYPYEQKEFYNWRHL